MKSQLQITFRNMKSSREVEEWIRDAAAKLDSFYSQIMGCRVELEIPHRHHKKGGAYHIRIDLRVPQGEIVVKREPNLSGTGPPVGGAGVEKACRGECAA